MFDSTVFSVARSHIGSRPSVLDSRPTVSRLYAVCAIVEHVMQASLVIAAGSHHRTATSLGMLLWLLLLAVIIMQASLVIAAGQNSLAATRHVCGSDHRTAFYGGTSICHMPRMSKKPPSNIGLLHTEVLQT